MESIYKEIEDLLERGDAGAICTVIGSRGSTPRHAGSKMLVFEDGTITGTVGGGEVENRVRQEALAAIGDGQSRRLEYSMVNPQEGDVGVCGGTMEIYVEPILPQPKLLIIGGGHVGRALAYLGKWLEFRIAISDDRSEFCNHQNNPNGDEFYPITMASLPETFHFTPRVFVVLTTRGSNVDVEGLPYLINQPFAYLGVIGSKRRWAVTRKAILEKGMPAELLDRVHSPIGLELKAETPEEIAVSIMAEIIMIRNGGTGISMKA